MLKVRSMYYIASLLSVEIHSSFQIRESSNLKGRNFRDGVLTTGGWALLVRSSQS